MFGKNPDKQLRKDSAHCSVIYWQRGSIAADAVPSLLHERLASLLDGPGHVPGVGVAAVRAGGCCGGTLRPSPTDSSRKTDIFLGLHLSA